MAYRVHVMQTAESFEVGANESVLDAALRQHVNLAHECTFGGCGTCRIKLVEGTVDYEEFPMALTPQEAQQGYALACQARPRSDLVISVTSALEGVAAPQRCTAVVREVRRLGADVANLRLELANVPELAYLPGQYMNVHLGDGTHRSFSMASLPDAGLIDFHVRRIAGGRFTEGQVGRLRPGDALDVELPLGTFRCHAEDYRPMLMVATGTGLAPIKSMLESLMDDPDCPPVSLYWGMRDEAGLYLDDEIRGWDARLYEFRYVPVLSRASLEWGGRRGHVQQAVVADLPDLSEHSIYLCGSPAMIDGAKQLFLAHGAELDHIYTDAFSFQHPVAGTGLAGIAGQSGTRESSWESANRGR
jgi:CDP-4-dehydro-6-deoxyglucose reductase